MTTNRSKVPYLIAAAAIIVVAPLALRAQAAPRPVTFGVQGGVTLPTGDYSDYGESGWNVGGFLQWRPENQVFGIRGELQYHRNDMKDQVIFDNGGSPGTTGNFGIMYLGVAPVLEVAPRESGIGWYILAGAGLYKVSSSISESGINVSADDNKFGFNAGAGLRFRFGSANLYAETRYHGVKVEDVNFTFMPFSVGISF